MDGLVSRLEKLTEIGIALSAERDTERLIELILLGAKAITNADGGSVYSLQSGRSLCLEIIRNDSLKLAMGGSTGEKATFSEIPLYKEDGSPNHHNVASCAVLQERTVNIADAYAHEGFDFSGTRAFDQRTGYRSTSFLTVPMKNHEGEIIGVLQLINAKGETDAEVIPFTPEAQRLVESLASQAAIALTNRQLIDGLRGLFDALIHLIANAIDEKSPYTGGHCRRVPVITMLLAEAADRAISGPLKDFHLSDQDRYELEIAAWLHDCGKIVTPEHVVDKSTKLEAIFDRLDLVNARFEILRRDAELEMLRNRLAFLEKGDAADADFAADYQKLLVELAEEQAFLARANTGGEFMSPDDQARVEAIARRRWLDVRGGSQPLLTGDEVKNLQISRGTLTSEEREVINHHVVATINMLESLPFPKHLRKVPEFAGGHHERVDGKGYPRVLRKEQMSVQARIVAIADIFEALTASDRPYRPGKKLSEAMRIMAFMKKEGHIDPDLFEVFLSEKVYDDYAARYLSPEQIDEVNTESLPT